MSSLELKPTGFRHPGKTYELVVREHDMAETNYYHIGYVSVSMAIHLATIVRGPSFLFGNPYTDKSAELQTCKFCGMTLPTVCKTSEDIKSVLQRFPNSAPTKEDPNPSPNPFRGKCDAGLKNYTAIAEVIEQENKL